MLMIKGKQTKDEIMKLLVLVLLVPSLSFAAIQNCIVNVYDRINDERIFNHSTEGKVVDSGNKVGLRVIADDYNITSWKMRMRKERPHDATYFSDITSDKGRKIFVTKFVFKNGDRQYMIFDDVKSKSYVFFECSEDAK